MIGYVANLVEELGPHENRDRRQFVFASKKHFGAAVLKFVGLVLQATDLVGLGESDLGGAPPKPRGGKVFHHLYEFGRRRHDVHDARHELSHRRLEGCRYPPWPEGEQHANVFDTVGDGVDLADQSQHVASVDRQEQPMRHPCADLVLRPIRLTFEDADLAGCTLEAGGIFRREQVDQFRQAGGAPLHLLHQVGDLRKRAAYEQVCERDTHGRCQRSQAR